MGRFAAPKGVQRTARSSRVLIAPYVFIVCVKRDVSFRMKEFRFILGTKGVD